MSVVSSGRVFEPRGRGEGSQRRWRKALNLEGRKGSRKGRVEKRGMDDSQVSVQKAGSNLGASEPSQFSVGNPHPTSQRARGKGGAPSDSALGIFPDSICRVGLDLLQAFLHAVLIFRHAGNMVQVGELVGELGKGIEQGRVVEPRNPLHHLQRSQECGFCFLVAAHFLEHEPKLFQWLHKCYVVGIDGFATADSALVQIHCLLVASASLKKNTGDGELPHTSTGNLLKARLRERFCDFEWG